MRRAPRLKKDVMDRNRFGVPVNFFAGAAFLVGVAGGKPIADVANGINHLERQVAAHASFGIAYLKIAVPGGNEVSSAVVASRRKILTSAHNFEGLVPECRGKTVSSCPQIYERIRKAKSKSNSVVFSLDPEGDLRKGKSGIQKDIVDIEIHPEYVIGDTSNRNRKHDVAIALLREEIPKEYNPVKFVTEDPAELYITGYGIQKIGQTGKEHDWIARIVGLEGIWAEDETGNEYFVADQAKQIGGLYGDSGSACLSKNGVFGIFSKHVSPGDIMDVGIITRLSDNIDFLAGAFDRLLAEDPNPFRSLISFKKISN